MKLPKYFVPGLLAVLLLAMCGLLWQQYRLAAARQTRAAAIERDRWAAEFAKGGSAAKKIAMPFATTGKARTELTPPRPTVPLIDFSIPPTPEQIKAWLHDAGDAAVMNALTLQAWTGIEGSYGYFFRQKHLTPEQTEAVIKLMCDQRMTPVDLAVASFQNGIDPRADLDAFQASVDSANAGIDNEIKVFLGENLYNEFRTFDQNRYQTDTMASVQRLVGDTANALTSDQLGKFASALRDGGGNGQMSPAVLTTAKTFLSASQLDAVQQVYETQKKEARTKLLQSLPPAPFPK